MGPLGVWRNIPFIALSKCSYKFPLWCLRKLYEKIIKKLHKLLWFTSNMLSNSPFYIIQVFTFPGKPPLFISASNIWAARPLLSLLIRWLVLFILVQWTANQLQGPFYTMIEKVTPVIDLIKNYFQSIIDLLDHPYAIILSICHPKDCHVFIHIILVSVNQREIFTLH